MEERDSEAGREGERIRVFFFEYWDGSLESAKAEYLWG
jgi:hypothetical protein